MSIDMYASRSPDDVVLRPEDEAVFKQLELHVHEWVGTGSFGARRYIELVDRVAGVALGYTWIPPDEVARMAAAFEARDAEEVARESGGDTYPATADQVRGLRQLLLLCATRGLGLYGM